MRSIRELKNIKGKRVLVRVDFNVPIEGGRVMDDFKIVKALSTIKFLAQKKAKVILITHIGRGEDSAEPTFKVLNKFIKATFVPDILGEKAKGAVSKMKDGEVLLLENLRRDRGEKDCNKIFALELSKYGDIYINDAFPVSHREDASIVLLPKILPSYAGFQLEKEVKNLSKALKPRHPFLFILGGVKFETKIPLLRKFLGKADKVFVGGGLANTLFFAKGYEIGQSVADREYKVDKNILNNKKIILPDQIVVDRGTKRLSINRSEVKKGDYIVDIGTESVSELKPIIQKAKLILWNGPIGWDGRKATEGTHLLLQILSKAKCETIIGGGDTAAAVQKLKLEDKFSFVSTGGGATLDFLATGTLPGIKALR